MPSIKIELHDGDASHTIRMESDPLRSHQGDVVAGRSAGDLLVDAVRAVERAADIQPRITHHKIRVEIDGESIGVKHVEIEQSIYDSVMRVASEMAE